YGPWSTAQCRPRGRVAAHRGASPRDGRRRGGGLDARLAGRDGGGRGRAGPGAGGGRDRRREPRADRHRPGRHRRCHQAYGRGDRTGPAVNAPDHMTVIRLSVPRAFAACAPCIRVRTAPPSDAVLELVRLGYVVNDSNAAFAVAYYAGTKLELDCGIQSDPLVMPYKPGTVMVDVIDPKTKQAIVEKFPS